MIKIENLNKSFGTQDIFKDYSLEIKENEFIVFTGESGCGKTTLLNMLGGIEKADSGKIIMDKYDLSTSRDMRLFYQNYVGFLFQNFALVDNKTVEENLNIIRPAARSGITIGKALENVGLSGSEKKKIYQLSGGEQQRVALARVMMKKCSLILADEPTGSLDKKNAVQVIKILKDLHTSGKTIIMVTHDSSLIDKDMRMIQIKK